ncbi:unnamed protein product [Laminaria digitata]
MTGEADMSEDMNTCTPRTDCTETCGEQDDGCGGTLDCGACACSDGLPTGDTSCGTCGLGQLSCAEGETGPGTCEQHELGEGVALPATACSALFHVAEGADANSADGSKESPFPLISDALDAARNTPGAVVLVSDGDYAESGLSVPDGTSLLGGMNQDFAFDGSLPTITVSAKGADTTVGIDVSDHNEVAYLGYLTLITEDVPADHSNVGARIFNAGDLTITHLDVTAGAGGAGQDGVDGMDGDDGGQGEDAQDAIRGGIEVIGGRSFNGAFPGTSGQNPGCPEANGGGGGVGARASVNDSNGAMPARHEAQPGFDTTGAFGGQAGTEAGVSNGGDGTTASAGAPGMAGTSGSASGQFEMGYWIQDGDGTDGAAGTFGYGGGGGGGTYWPSDTDQDFGDIPGGSGGGGGAGGCGGQAGTAGKKGGSSMGLLVVSSDGLTIIDSSFASSTGGQGGAGGRGGRGGDGADGGIGTTHYKISTGSSSRTPHTLTAGVGGKGGDGGIGGDAGSGAGGASFGGLCEASRVTLVGEVNFTAAAAGSGGQGRVSAPNGRSEDQTNCVQ